MQQLTNGVIKHTSVCVTRQMRVRTSQMPLTKEPNQEAHMATDLNTTNPSKFNRRTFTKGLISIIAVTPALASTAIASTYTPTIEEYVTALEQCGGQVIEHNGSLFLGGPDAPENFWETLTEWKSKMAHVDNLNKATLEFIQNRQINKFQGDGLYDCREASGDIAQYKIVEKYSNMDRCMNYHATPNGFEEKVGVTEVYCRKSIGEFIQSKIS